MSYNTDRRKPLSKKARAGFLAAHDYTCHWCKGLITTDEWDDDHLVPKELLPPGSDWNDLANRAPIHRDPCHKAKTKRDVAAIAKSNRIRRANGPPDLRKKKAPIRARPFQKGRRPMPSRPFPRKDH